MKIKKGSLYLYDKLPYYVKDSINLYLFGTYLIIARLCISNEFGPLLIAWKANESERKGKIWDRISGNNRGRQIALGIAYRVSQASLDSCNKEQNRVWPNVK